LPPAQANGGGTFGRQQQAGMNSDLAAFAWANCLASAANDGIVDAVFEWFGSLNGSGASTPNSSGRLVSFSQNKNSAGRSMFIHRRDQPLLHLVGPRVFQRPA
jgi:hypothetical protein